MIFKVQNKIYDGLSISWTSGENYGGDEKVNQPGICVWYDGARGGRMRQQRMWDRLRCGRWMKEYDIARRLTKVDAYSSDVGE
jgi:hypothetical protein